MGPLKLLFNHKACLLICLLSLTIIIMREGSERHMKQQIALITGSNRGICFEIVKQLAVKKIEVILASRNLGNGEASVRKLARDGVKSSGYGIGCYKSSQC